MVSYSVKLDSTTKQHTQFGVSASNGSRDMAQTKVAEKKEKKKSEKKKYENRQSHKASPTGIANNNETGSLSPCMRPRSDHLKMKNSNVVRSRLITLINEEINRANWMVRNSAKLDRRTKQHTQFGVSARNGSRYMARTKSWQKKRKKQMARTKSWRKKKISAKKNKKKESQQKKKKSRRKKKKNMQKKKKKKSRRKNVKRKEKKSQRKKKKLKKKKSQPKKKINLGKNKKK